MAHQLARIHRAVIEIVGGRGYEALKIVEILRLAAISSHTFYELFDDKDDCLLGTYDLIVRSLRRRVVAVQEGQENRRHRLEQALVAFGRAVAEEQNAARFALVEVFAGGPAVLARMGKTTEEFEAVLSDIMGCASDNGQILPLVLKGIIAGIVRVARARLLEGRACELPAMAAPLTDWTIRLACPEAVTLERLERTGVLLPPKAPALSPIIMTDRSSHRARLLAAVLSLAAEQGYWQITVQRLRAEARVSRTIFAAHFRGVDDCFGMALAEMTERAMGRAIRAAETTQDWPLGIYRALLELCNMLAADPVFAKLAFTEIFAPGVQGIRYREEIMADVTECFRASAPDAWRVEQLTAEASVGAIWSIVHHHVVTGQTLLLPQRATMLCFVALAPLIGSEHALVVVNGWQRPS